MAKCWQYLSEAAQMAYDNKDYKNYYLCALGVRRDGAVVKSCNIPNIVQNHKAHAECRLVRKLDKGSTVYVSRVSRSGHVCMARPCPICYQFLKRKGVKRCYYTISESEYGTIDF